MPRCPLCDEDIHADEAAFNHHVNQHLDEGNVGSSVSQPVVNGFACVNSAAEHGHGYPNGPSKASEAGLLPESADDDEAECPVCGYPLVGVSEVERQRHINACLDGGHDASPAADGFADSGPSAPGVKGNPFADDDERDFVFTPETMQRNGQAAGDTDWVEVGWDGPAKPSGWHDWVNKKVERGDCWWDPVSGPTFSVPSNFYPSLLPILQRLLRVSVSRHITRHAVLSSSATLIRGVWGWDMGWGCGYRNSLMAITALLEAKEQYRMVFDKVANGSDPGLRRIQGWLEQAWAEAFDPPGREHFRGKILGTRKWIGTSDMYAVLSYKGIPCELFDFPKPKGGRGMPRTAHIALQQWVRSYFADDAQEKSANGGGDRSAFNVLMRSDENGQGRGEAVRTSSKLPLILQHSGHSRTIVGYEENAQGNINLLLFDPARSMSKDLRQAGIEQLEHSREVIQRRESPTHLQVTQAGPSSRRSATISRHSSRRTSSHRPSHESLRFEPPYSNGAGELVHPAPVEDVSTEDGDDIEIVDAPDDSPAAPSTPDLVSDDQPERLRDDEEMDDRGWVRRKFSKAIAGGRAPAVSGLDAAIGDLTKSLGYFRVNLGKLSSHTEYQVLAFTGGPLLSMKEREARKTISSTVIN